MFFGILPETHSYNILLCSTVIQEAHRLTNIKLHTVQTNASILREMLCLWIAQIEFELK